ncbi:MAG: hypothetical protein O2782_05670 [bacterium]|nr:hypothetical protein [bacterium]
MRGLSILAVLFLAGACGRYFPATLQPSQQQGAGMTVNDDGSITYTLDRLAITLKPMADAELNRLASPSGDTSVNPYTFGEDSAPGEDWTRPRFTVFRVQVANYQYPKVRLDPIKGHITAANGREYGALSYAQLYEYYRAHWQGRTGQGRGKFRDRTDMLKRTMFAGNIIFSGSDEEGYIVFPLLDDDVQRIRVDLEDVAVRFNFIEEPVETVDLSFSFERDIRRGFTPSDAVREN